MVRDANSGRYGIELPQMETAIQQLAKELLEQEASGDRARAERWFAKYDVLSPQLQALLAQQRAIPVDIAPVFTFPVKVR